jgi:hypothetical protein
MVVHRRAFDVLANMADHAQPLPSASCDVLFTTDPGLHADGLQITLPARSAAIVRR